MKQKRVLIAGGYGAVGGRLSRIFAGNKNIIPVVAGRNETKASVLAKELNCQWQVVDLEDKESIREALDGIDIVINCFIASENFNLYLPETAIEKGIHYLDLSGYNEYCEGIIRLKDSAEKNESLLITALGAYPCIGGLVLASNKDYFDEIASVDIYFTMGGKLGGLSVLSLKGANYMVNTAPLVWKEGQWRKPDKTSTKEHVGGPFNKKISFYPGMITYDLYFVPGLEKIKHIASWSGMENMFQALVFVIGMKLGWAKNDKRAKRFLKILKYLGRGKKNHEDISLKIVTRGLKDGEQNSRIVEMNADEDFLTAVAAAVVCNQVIDGKISTFGAFAGPQVVDPNLFLDSLKKFDVNYKETWQGSAKRL